MRRQIGPESLVRKSADLQAEPSYSGADLATPVDFVPDLAIRYSVQVTRWQDKTRAVRGPYKSSVSVYDRELKVVLICIMMYQIYELCDEKRMTWAISALSHGDQPV